MLRTREHRVEPRSRSLPEQDYNAKPRIYFSGADALAYGSNYLKDNFVKGALKSTGLPPNTKTVWSRKAGCKCGCTPGFIVQLGWQTGAVMARKFGRLTSDEPFDIIVELEERR